MGGFLKLFKFFLHLFWHSVLLYISSRWAAGVVRRLYNWCKLVLPVQETGWRVLKKWKLEAYGPAIALRIIYPRKFRTLVWEERRVGTPVFTEAVIAMAKTGTHPCPPVDHRVRRTWNTHTMECYPARKAWHLSTCSNTVCFHLGYSCWWRGKQTVISLNMLE